MYLRLYSSTIGLGQGVFGWNGMFNPDHALELRNEGLTQNVRWNFVMRT